MIRSIASPFFLIRSNLAIRPFKTFQKHTLKTTPTLSSSHLSPRDYHRFSDQYLDTLVESLEDLGDSIEVAGYDVLYAVRDLYSDHDSRVF